MTEDERKKLEEINQDLKELRDCMARLKRDLYKSVGNDDIILLDGMQELVISLLDGSPNEPEESPLIYYIRLSVRNVKNGIRLRRFGGWLGAAGVVVWGFFQMAEEIIARFFP